ncbi:MAG: hypothetical protein H7329_20730 [Opitutaceae bacterium]|nr:hypothetical protein [Cytophagales bacterium]
MKHFFSIAVFALIPFFKFCERPSEIVQPEKTLIIRTIDGEGKPVKSTLIYESRDCEYDFLNPSHVSSDNSGIIKLKVPAGYLQFYVENYIGESYRCINYEGSAQILTVYGAPIPTNIQTYPFAEIRWWANSSGNCDPEPNVGTIAKADKKGKAVLYLPFQDTYKIQVDQLVQCFQPDQEVHTLNFNN